MVNVGKPGAGRSGRPRAGEERLSRQTILEAALRIVDDEGLEAMTMRRLAATLGVNPMSIYHHLPNKAAVFAGLAELVFADLNNTSRGEATASRKTGRQGDGPSSTRRGQAAADRRGGRRSSRGEVPWRDELLSAAHAYRNALRAHPNLALQVLADAAAVSEVVVVTVEPFYRALDRAGLTPREIFEAVNTLIDFIHGFSLGEASVQADTFELAPDLVERVSKLPPGQAPTLTRIVGELGADGLHYEFDDGFETGLSLFVDGIRARFGR